MRVVPSRSELGTFENVLASLARRDRTFYWTLVAAARHCRGCLTRDAGNSVVLTRVQLSVGKDVRLAALTDVIGELHDCIAC